MKDQILHSAPQGLQLASIDHVLEPGTHLRIAFEPVSETAQIIEKWFCDRLLTKVPDNGS